MLFIGSGNRESNSPSIILGRIQRVNYTLKNIKPLCRETLLGSRCKAYVLCRLIKRQARRCGYVLNKVVSFVPLVRPVILW